MSYDIISVTTVLDLKLKSLTFVLNFMSIQLILEWAFNKIILIIYIYVYVCVCLFMGMFTCAQLLQEARGGHWIPLKSSFELTDAGAADGIWVGGYAGLSHLFSTGLSFLLGLQCLHYWAYNNIVTSLKLILFTYTYIVLHIVYMCAVPQRYLLCFSQTISSPLKNLKWGKCFLYSCMSSPLSELFLEFLSGAVSFLPNVFTHNIMSRLCMSVRVSTEHEGDSFPSSREDFSLVFLFLKKQCCHFPRSFT